MKDRHCSDWWLRHSINEAMRNHVDSYLAVARYYEALRNGGLDDDPVAQEVAETVRNLYKHVQIVSSGCGDDVLMFVFAKRE